MNKDIIEKINKFTKDRNWEQHHSGVHIAKALIIEAAELLELYQWKDEVNDIERLKEELADVLIYSVRLAEHYQIDIDEIILNKLKKNAEKYPINKAFGKSNKYNEL